MVFMNTWNVETSAVRSCFTVLGNKCIQFQPRAEKYLWTKKWTIIWLESFKWLLFERFVNAYREILDLKTVERYDVSMLWNFYGVAWAQDCSGARWCIRGFSWCQSVANVQVFQQPTYTMCIETQRKSWGRRLFLWFESKLLVKFWLTIFVCYFPINDMLRFDFCQFMLSFWKLNECMVACALYRLYLTHSTYAICKSFWAHEFEVLWGNDSKLTIVYVLAKNVTLRYSFQVFKRT